MVFFCCYTFLFKKLILFCAYLQKKKKIKKKKKSRTQSILIEIVQIDCGAIIFVIIKKRKLSKLLFWKKFFLWRKILLWEGKKSK
jgi:hypothetical protein